jgi:hypothetical protein
MARQFTSLALIAGALLASEIHASPLFSIGDCVGCMSWSDALASGRIQPAAGLTGPEEAFYTGTGETFSFSTPELFAQNVTDGDGDTFNALVMAWNNDQSVDLSISAWEYVYDVDPNLTGTLIELSLFYPPPMWDFSIELVDANGKVRGWFVDVMAAGLVANQWHTITLNPGLLAPQGFIPGPIQDPGFDLTQVTKIRLDEAGMTTVTLTPPPPGGTIVGQWNAWNHLRVRPIPEPLTVTLMLVGLAGISASRRSHAQ